MILQCVTVVLCIAGLIMPLADWNRRGMRFMFPYALFTIIFSFARLIEITADTPAHAETAFRTAYAASPFIIIFSILLRLERFSKFRCKPWQLFFYLTFAATISLNFILTDLVFAKIVHTHPFITFVPGNFYYVWCALEILSIAVVTVLTFHAMHSKGGIFGIRLAFHIAVMALLILLTTANIFECGTNRVALRGITSALSLLTLTVYQTVMKVRERHNLGRKLFIEMMDSAYVLMDGSGNLIDSNAKARELFPKLKTTTETYTQSEAIPYRLLTNAEETTPYGDLHNAVKDGTTTSEMVPYTTPSGKQIILRAARSYTEMEGDSGKSAAAAAHKKKFVALLINDCTEEYRLLQHLQDLTSRDTLTGLYNRRTFFEMASRSFNFCKREKSYGAVLMSDLDNFKHINETYGQRVGDMVLMAVTAQIGKHLRSGDIYGLYSGDEVVIWLSMTDSETAVRIAEDIRRSVENSMAKLQTEAAEVTGVTISVGVAAINFKEIQTDLKDETFDKLVNHADKALLTCKREGKNKVVFTGGAD